jgi:cell division septal protein FtsQ
MGETKKIKKKRFNILKFLVFCLFIYLIITVIMFLFNKPIKNIIILNNEYLSDEEIIETAKIENYPSFFETFSHTIKKRIMKLDLVEDVEVKKKIGYIVEIKIKEHKILYQNKNNNLYVLEDGVEVELTRNINSIPILINYVPENILKNFNEGFAKKIDKNVIEKISEIEYVPTDYDKDRFLLYMVDENQVYITITKLKALNKYIQITEQLNGHSGILYLDSGNYFEIKK